MSTTYDNVILFGAGASFDARVPMMNSFIDSMWEYAIRGKAPTGEVGADDRQILEKANEIRRGLEAYNSRAFFDDRNVEDILSLLSFEALGNSNDDRFQMFVRALARTIELACIFPPRSLLPNSPYFHNVYHEFWHGILKAQRNAGAQSAILSFNYDLVLERALWEYFHGPKNTAYRPPVQSVRLNYSFFGYDFGVKMVDHTYSQPHSSTPLGFRADFLRRGEFSEVEIPILKLHGSLNWSRSDAAAWKENPELVLEPKLPLTHVVEDPVILPPVFNKMNASEVYQVWKRALELLRGAKHIIVVGYSLPRTDIYMQYFLKCAVGPNSNLQKIIVFNPELHDGNGDGGNAMRRRYLECFSPQFAKRIAFGLSTERKSGVGTFRHFVDELSVERPTRLFFLP